MRKMQLRESAMNPGSPTAAAAASTRADPRAVQKKPSLTEPNKFKRHVLALDVGTSSIRCFVVDDKGAIVGGAREPIRVLSPGPGLEEIDPDHVWQDSVRVVKMALADARLAPSDVRGLGISVQRGTFTTWDKKTGKVFHNFVTWRDLRAAQLADSANKSATLRAVKCGGTLLHFLTRMPKFIVASILRFRSNFTSVVLSYMLTNHVELRKAVAEKNVCFGTIESFLVYRLTGGKVHAMDYSCASATAMFDPFLLKWSDLVLQMLGVPKSIFPAVLPTAHRFGFTDESLFGAPIPICCLVGDQTASLFGSCSFSPGDVKLTLGTGGFISCNTGTLAYANLSGIYPLCAWKLGESEPVIYAAEGGNSDTGTVIQWAVRAGLVANPGDTERLAESAPVSTSERLFFVPAFNGLHAPGLRDSQAAAGFIGLLPYMTQAHMVRAVLDSVAYRSYQLCCAIHDDYEARRDRRRGRNRPIKVDGGVSQNGYIMQLLADLCGRKLICSMDYESAALGTAYIVGLQTKLWESEEDLKKFYRPGKVYLPNPSNRAQVQRNFRRWQDAVCRFGSWYSGIEREEMLRVPSVSTSFDIDTVSENNDGNQESPYRQLPVSSLRKQSSSGDSLASKGQQLKDFCKALKRGGERDF
ncbi:unnamed protein product [Notodromas monacha]|uniref:glycerol kinase n=1 Tax=Notodromas monacha TaxID=399045 RepID=A0A7R9BV45_9CRUS|nr:unnamed protein product [Notodromas monacha]CAG0920783.1 unnamed protein product [Notodromas monacha]